MRKVNLIEVGPRDGFQSVKTFIPTALKIEIIDKLVQAGYRNIEATSFVNPKAIPQMCDARSVITTVQKKHPEVVFSALVPNRKGAQNAAEAGVHKLATLISLSESHNMANVKHSREWSLEEIRTIHREYPMCRIQVTIATAFGCPFEGRLEFKTLLNLLDLFCSEGIQEFTLCDTTGMALPSQVEKTVSGVKRRFPDQQFDIHIHDTRNMGILNSWVAIQAGIDGVETSVGGLGGCPFAPEASGNTASEDFVYLLNNEGFDTGIDFDNLLQTARFLHEHVDGNYSSHQIKIGKERCQTQV